MQEKLEEWAKRLESEVAAERSGERFSLVRRPGEYINLFGHGTILEIVLEREVGVCRAGTYVRIDLSAHSPQRWPFLYWSYVSAEYPTHPKTDYYLDTNPEQTSKPAFAAHIEKELFGSPPQQ